MFRPNEYKYHASSSSQSDDLEEPESHRQQKISPSDKGEDHGQQFEKDEDDSLSEEDSSIQYPQDLPKKYGLAGQPAEEEESDEEDEKSIDEIEERIKRLEKDLQTRIDKQKKETNSKNSSNQKGKIIQNVSAPNIPKHQPFSSAPRPEGKDKPASHVPTKVKPQSAVEADKVKKESGRNKEVLGGSPSKKQPLQTKHPINIIHEKQRVESRKGGHDRVQQGYQAQQLSKANKQMQQLQRTITELKLQNKKLKDQVNHYKKKKPIQEIDRLKEFSGKVQVEGDSKLQKQLQLLKIIEGLQSKLKKSITRKLNRCKTTNTSSALLHRGLPANALS